MLGKKIGWHVENRQKNIPFCRINLQNSLPQATMMACSLEHVKEGQ